MDGLKSLLDGLAREAPRYDVVDRAERVVRRRRRMVRLAPVAAGVAVVLVLGAGWVVLRDADSRPVTRPGTPAAWLPPQLSVVKDPLPLPADRGIGPASLLYIPRKTTSERALPGTRPPMFDEAAATAVIRIVTPDGRQYGVAAEVNEAGHPSPASLSPDGRWLAVGYNRGLVLRDLTGTSERTVTTYSNGSTHTFWSPDSRQLVLVRSTPSAADSEVRVIDVLSGSQSTASSLAAFRDAWPAWPIGVDTAGNLVLKSETSIPGTPTSVLTLWLVDPVTGRERRHLVVDPRTLLGSSASAEQGEQAMVLGVCFLAGDSLLVLTADLITDDRGGLLVIDLETGKLIEQHALPGDEAAREPLTASPETILLIRRGPSRDHPEAALEQLDRKTGELRVVTSIIGDIGLPEVRGMLRGA